ncbi:MAG: AsmA family protein [Flavobacterium sp.]
MKKKASDKIRRFSASRWFRITMRILAVVVTLIVITYLSLVWYVNTHKDEILKKVTSTLNESMSGTIAIGDIEPTFLKGFPRVSLRLDNVTVKDSLFSRHKKVLLQAEEIDLALNALALIRGTIEIKKVGITNAALSLYTMPDGYSNTSVFRKGRSTGAGEGGSFPELRRFVLDNVSLEIDNRRMGKLYSFSVNSLKGKIDYKAPGWKADVQLNTLVNSMAFSTQKGSFMKGRVVDGNFVITFDEDKQELFFKKNKLEIGGEEFYVAARMKTGGPTADFTINIENKGILWKDAANLLSPNITRKLVMYDIKKPISVRCDLIGDFNKKGDPLIYVKALIENNAVDTPGGLINDCSFTGIFTNNNVKANGFNDANSAVKLLDFTGDYSGIPVRMKQFQILNLEKPIAKGDLRSVFDVKNLSKIIDVELLDFKKGRAEVAVDFTADIVDFKLAKPKLKGLIKVDNATITYTPRKLSFNDVNVALNFTDTDLYISKIALKTGRSIVNMEGSIKNFLNVYYDAPEQVVLNWKIHSPKLYLGEFMAFLNARNPGKKINKKAAKGNVTEDLNTLFEKSNVDMELVVDNLYYNSFHATKARAKLLLTDNAIILKDAGLSHAGGTLRLDGVLGQTGKYNKYKVNADVRNVDVRRFFSAFDSFGIESLQPENLRGALSAQARLTGLMDNTGQLSPKSMQGNLGFTLKNGALLRFAPVKSVGKFAFPFRDMDNITFNNLKGQFAVNGEKVNIKPMQINSSVLNMDVAGVYSFGKGTNIAVDVPLRNPKRDQDITDEKELAKRRNRGIVLHLVAQDDEETGKVKVKLGRGTDN